jgi:hypothetical protein
MNINDVVTVVTVAGEYIGRLKSQGEETVEIDNPRGLMQGENGIGFAPSVCMTGDTTNTVHFNKSTILFTVKTLPEVEKAWQQATSGIVLS